MFNYWITMVPMVKHPVITPRPATSGYFRAEVGRLLLVAVVRWRGEEMNTWYLAVVECYR